MKRLIIAIDCDDVLVESTRFIVESYNKRYSARVQLESAHLSGNPDWGAAREEVHRRINAIQLSDTYGSLAPSKQTVDAVNRLASLHEIHVVTARVPEIAEVTKRMIDSYFPNCFSSIEHVGFNTSKTQACLAIKAQVLVDDGLKHLQDANNAGIDHLLWFGNYPWQDRSKIPVGITVTGDWADALKQLEIIGHE